MREEPPLRGAQIAGDDVHERREHTATPHGLEHIETPHGPEHVATPRGLTHVDERGAARMVDVGDKAATERRAVARGMLRLSEQTVALVRDGRAPKGDVLAAARIAGIMAAKRTSDLIPLCHPLPLTHVAVELEVQSGGVEITATAATHAPTGVEMEALTAVSVAGLTLYDMLKAVERGARLTDVRLVGKTGGRSGDVSPD